MNIRFFTDKNEFAFNAKQKISNFKNISNEAIRKNKFSSSDIFRTYLGYTNIEKGNIGINLPLHLDVSDQNDIDFIESVSDTIKHEVLHKVIYDCCPEANVPGSEKIIRSLDINHIKMNIRRARVLKNQELFFGKRK
jgi:hypothetical protein